MGCCSYCILCGDEDERETCYSWGAHLANPLDRLRIQHLAIIAEHPQRKKCLPRTDTHHVMGPMHVAYAVCSVYMPLYGAGSTWKLLRLGHRHRSKPDPSLQVLLS